MAARSDSRDRDNRDEDEREEETDKDERDEDESDEDERDEEKSPRAKRRRNAGELSISFPKLLAIIGIVAWALLFFAMACGGLLFCSAIGRSESAPQDAAAGAIFSTIFIGLYISVRCIEKILQGVERVRPK